MALNSDFAARCNALRASARQLLKDKAARPDALQQVAEGRSVTAAPSILRMSMGEVRKKKTITLCTFSRSELMVCKIFVSLETKKL